jgi:hypothetical protein
MAGLAAVYIANQQFGRAERLLARVLQIYEADPGQYVRQAFALNDLAILYQHRQRPAEAEALFHKALLMLEKRPSR